MSNRAAHILGWVTVTLSLIVGLLGAAPFTPAIFLVAFLLPAAAIVACAEQLSLVSCPSCFVYLLSPSAPCQWRNSLNGHLQLRGWVFVWSLLFLAPFTAFAQVASAMLHNLRKAKPNIAFERDAPKAARPSTLR